MRFFAVGLLFCSVVLLSACTSHEKDYLKNAGQINSLVVPSDVPMIKQESYYPIPATPVNVSTKPMSLVPPTLTNKEP